MNPPPDGKLPDAATEYTPDVNRRGLLWWLAPTAAAAQPWPRIVALFSFMLLAIGAGPAPEQSPQASPASAVPAFRQANNVAIITIHDQITAVTARSIERRLKLAERAGANAVVIELDTPGGDLGACLEICNAIKQSPIQNTVAWVHPNAYSAGAIIALACREIVASDPASMGDALPIGLGRGGNLVSLPEAERQKITSPLIAEVVDSARRNGYDEYLVQGFVALGVELWQVENTKTGKRMCINEEEYTILFGAAPPRGMPDIVASRALQPTPGARMPRPDARPPVSAPVPTEAPVSADPAPSPEQTQPAESPATPDAAPSAPAPDADSSKPQITGPDADAASEYKPASGRLAPMARDVSMALEHRSERAVISADQQGQWKFVRYVSDGNGPIILKGDQFARYGFSQATIHNDDELKAFFGARHVVRLDQTWSESLVVFLTHIVVRGVLITIFLIALFLEMTHPGLVLPGAIAGVALLALLAPPLLIGMASWWEVAAILGGIALLALELLVIPGFGVTGVAGILLLFAGLVGTFVPAGSSTLFPDTPRGRSELLYGATTILTAMFSAGVGMYVLAKNFGSLPVLNRLVLKDTPPDDENQGVFSAIASDTVSVSPGQIGIALTPLRPAGRVQIGDGVFDVVSDLGYVPAGSKVKILSASPFRIAVEPVEPPGGDPAQPPSTPTDSGRGTA